MAKIIPIGGTTCPDCEGKGVKDFFIDDHYNDGDLIDCPTCDGKGWVFEESEVSDETWD